MGDYVTLRYVAAPPYPAPPAGRCLPRPRRLYHYLHETWPSSDLLGCYHDRSITGGSTPSVHRDGRAFDIGFLDQEAARQDCYTFLIDHAHLLGLQMVLNYWRHNSPSSGVGWRLPRYSGEQTPRTFPWNRKGHWLHVELHPTVALLETPIEELVGPALPVPAPPKGPRIVMITADMQQIRRGDSGGFVTKAQAILTANFGQDIAADGLFGALTDQAVRNVQRFFGLDVDGIVGPQTWGTLLEVAP